MHSMFLPGQPLPDLDEVQVGHLYHVQLPDGSLATVKLNGDAWEWRSLTSGRAQRGDRPTLEQWLAAPHSR